MEKDPCFLNGFYNDLINLSISILEKYNHLLFYPVQYEGLEQSPNIPAELAGLVMQLLDKNPHLRPTAREVTEHLQAVKSSTGNSLTS